MSNVLTLETLHSQIPYRSDGMKQWLSALRRNVPPTLLQGDNLLYYSSITISTTAVEINAGAGYLHGVYIESRGALGYLTLYNIVQGGTTVGTLPTMALPFTATSGQSTACWFGGTGNGTAPLFATALTAGVATTTTGTGAVATLPLVIIAYS